MQQPFATGCDCSYAPRGFCKPADNGRVSRVDAAQFVHDYGTGCSRQCCTWQPPELYGVCMQPPYCRLTSTTDPPVVANLLAQMTTREKISQLLVLDYRVGFYMNGCLNPAAKLCPEFVEMLEGTSTGPDRVDSVGSVLGGSDAFFKLDTPQTGRLFASVQASAKKHRLQIPVLVGIDAIHGNGLMPGTTVFPHNIGLGCAEDPQIVHETYRATAVEIRAQGVHWDFAPALSVAQDVRWGRTYESFGPDANLVSDRGSRDL